jgi:hypothetical protein
VWGRYFVTLHARALMHDHPDNFTCVWLGSGSEWSRSAPLFRVFGCNRVGAEWLQEPKDTNISVRCGTRPLTQIDRTRALPFLPPVRPPSPAPDPDGPAEDAGARRRPPRRSPRRMPRRTPPARSRPESRLNGMVLQPSTGWNGFALLRSPNK